MIETGESMLTFEKLRPVILFLAFFALKIA